MPLFSARMPRQKSALPTPMHVIGPTPVITARRRFDHIARWAFFEKMNVPVMRQNRWPEFEIGRRVENALLRSANEDRVGGVHELLLFYRAKFASSRIAPFTATSLAGHSLFDK